MSLNQKKNIIFVLGMHRSGTSALTQLLKAIGIELGDEKSILKTKLRSNPIGHYEHKLFQELNEALLNQHHCDWFKIADLDVGSFSNDLVNNYQEAFVNIVEQESQNGIIALKDPRMCLFFDLVRSLPYQYHCIHIIRNPLEVALSLCERNGFNPFFSLALWKRYNAAALTSTNNGVNRIIISHQELMSSPLVVAEKLHDYFERFIPGGLKPINKCALSSVIKKKLYRQQLPEELLFYLEDAGITTITNCLNLSPGDCFDQWDSDADEIIKKYEDAPRADEGSIIDFSKLFKDGEKSMQKVFFDALLKFYDNLIHAEYAEHNLVRRGLSIKNIIKYIIRYNKINRSRIKQYKLEKRKLNEKVMLYR